MLESYALMILVMGAFFVYFCGMVWAFCNPKLSEEEPEDRKETARRGHFSCPRALNHPQQDVMCVCARLPAAPHTEEPITRSTYVSFWDDTESLLSDCTVFGRDDLGINNGIGESRSWNA